MTDLLDELGARIKSLAGSWASYTAIGSFALYVLGYLAVRFHLTALGVGTDLTVLDERYLFTGARFIVYLFAAVPSAVLFALLLGIVGWVVTRLMTAQMRTASAQWTAQAIAWLRTPERLALAGVTFSVVIIQFFMRDCFELSNLLLRERLPADNYLAAWLARSDEGRISLFFAGLVGAWLISAGAMLGVRRLAIAPNGRASLLWVLLAFLTVVQFLLLPVNYGYLVVDQQIPRVASLDGATPLPEATEAWLVWEGKEGFTFLVRRTQAGKSTRSLLFWPKADVKKIEITGYDYIVPTLFAAQGGAKT